MSISGYGSGGGGGASAGGSSSPVGFVTGQDSTQASQDASPNPENLNRIPLPQYNQQADSTDLFGSVTDEAGNPTRDEEILRRSLEESFRYEMLFDSLTFEESLEYILPNIHFSEPSEIRVESNLNEGSEILVNYVMRFELVDEELEFLNDETMNLMKKYIKVSVISIHHQNILRQTANNGLCRFLDNMANDSEHVKIKTFSLESARLDADNPNLLKFEFKNENLEPAIIEYQNRENALAFFIRVEFDYDKLSSEYDFEKTDLMKDTARNGKGSLVVLYERGAYSPYRREFVISSEAYPDTEYIFKNDIWQGPTSTGTFSWLDYRYDSQLVTRSEYYMPEYIMDDSGNEIALVKSRILNEVRTPIKLIGENREGVQAPKQPKVIKTSYRRLSSIGDLYLAKSVDRTGQLIFSIDRSLMAKQTTAVPELFDFSSRFLEKTKINNMKIFRQRVKSATDFNDQNEYNNEPVLIAEAYDTEFGEFVVDDNPNGTISEIQLHIIKGNRDLRHFSVTDLNISKQDYGDYLYSVEIVFENLASDLVEELHDSIVVVEASFNVYRSNVENQIKRSKQNKLNEAPPANYSNPVESTSISREYVEEAADQYSQDGSLPWVDFVTQYIEAAKIISNEENNYIELAREKLMGISPFSGKIRKIREFSNELSMLIERFRMYMDRLGLISPINSLGRKIDRTKIIRHEFNNVEEILSNPFVGYSFLELGSEAEVRTDGLQRVSLDSLNTEYQTRVGLDTSGFADNADDNQDNQEALRANLSLNSDLSPSSVKLPGEAKPLSFGNTTSDVARAKILNWNNFSNFSEESDIDCESDVSPEAQKEQEILLTLLNESGVSIGLSSEIQMRSVPLGENIDNFNIKEFERIEESDENGPRVQRRVGLSRSNVLGLVKRMTGGLTKATSDFQACKANESASPDSDLADIRETVSARVEYLTGFKTDEQNESILKSPVWENLSNLDLENLQINRPLFCRIVLSDDVPEKLKLPVMNKYFLFTGNQEINSILEDYGLSSETYIEDPALRDQLTEMDNQAMVKAIAKV